MISTASANVITRRASRLTSSGHDDARAARLFSAASALGRPTPSRLVAVWLLAMMCTLSACDGGTQPAPTSPETNPGQESDGATAEAEGRGAASGDDQADAGPAPSSAKAQGDAAKAPTEKTTAPPKRRAKPDPDEDIPQKERYVFEFQPFTVNESYRIVSTDETTMNIKTEIGKETIEGKTSTQATTTLQLTIGEIKDGDVTKVAHSYGEVRQKEDDNGKLARFQSPVTNKTYLIDLSQAEPAITYRSGGRPSKAELQHISQDISLVSLSKRFFEMIPRGPLKPGSVSAPSIDAIKAFAFEPGTRILSIQKPELTFKEARKVDGFEAGIFELRFNAVLLEQGLTINTPLTGELAMDIARGRLLRVIWSAPVAMTGKTKDGDVEVKIGGTGTTRQEQVALYPRQADAP